MDKPHDSRTAASDAPEALKEWAGKVTRGVSESAVFCSLWNDAMLNPRKDPAPMIQIGYAMLLDKPIIVVAPHGSHIPENVKRVAKVIEWFDKGEADSLHAATLRALAVVGIDPTH